MTIALLSIGGLVVYSAIGVATYGLVMRLQGHAWDDESSVFDVMTSMFAGVVWPLVLAGLLVVGSALVIMVIFEVIARALRFDRLLRFLARLGNLDF